MKYRKRNWFIVLPVALLVVAATIMAVERANAPVLEELPQPTEEVGFDASQHSIDEPGSPWWIVNRERPLPDGYVPPDLTIPNVRLRLDPSAEQMQFSRQATPAIEEMFAAAQADGVELVFGSGYRSEALQRQFYESYVARDGQAAADRYSARPGTSEHQTGLAVDITTPSGVCHLEICFEDTPQGQWVAENAHKHGFIIRYLDSKEDITGYQYEPWHLRYVGVELATELHEANQTMEEFFDLVSATQPPMRMAFARTGDCACCCS